MAHNAPFDLRFLNYERRRLWGRYFTQPLAGHPRAGPPAPQRPGRAPRPGSLSVWADTVVRPTHRALPDAEATAEVLVRLIGMLEDRGIDTLERAVHFGGLGGARHAYKLALAEDLPTCPGVYVMRDRDGKALYVGKAGNLRRRVRSVLRPRWASRPPHRAGPRAARVDRARDVRIRVRRAAARGRADQEPAPPVQPARHLRPGPLPEAQRLRRRPRLYAVPRVRRDGAAYFGPLRSARLTREAVACLSELYPINDPDPDARAQALSRLDAVLRGDPPAIGELGVLLGAGMATGAVAIDDGGGVAPATRTVEPWPLWRARGGRPRPPRCSSSVVRRPARPRSSSSAAAWCATRRWWMRRSGRGRRAGGWTSSRARGPRASRPTRWSRRASSRSGSVCCG